MPDLTALEAKFKAALTLHAVSLTDTANELSTVGLRAPSKIRIGVHVNVLLEFEVLIIDLLRPKSFDILTGVLGRASLIGALDLLDLAVRDVEL